MGIDDRDPPDRNELANASSEPEGPGQRGLKIWRHVIRPGLQLIEVGALLKQHEALAAGARAFVMIGDVIMERDGT
jgi:hypothetical protein